MECGQRCRTTFVIRRFARSSRTDGKQRGGDRWPEAATTGRRGGERTSNRQHGRRLEALEAAAAAASATQGARRGNSPSRVIAVVPATERAQAGQLGCEGEWPG
ncbi:hypothetical protein MRX96_016864 [Rhipicephalus microplus]